jgi:hypothetical protein
LLGIQEQIRKARNEFDIRKRQCENHLSAKVQEATEKLAAQATIQHDTFINMSANNMLQYTVMADTLIKNKMQELVDVTAISMEARISEVMRV